MELVNAYGQLDPQTSHRVILVVWGSLQDKVYKTNPNTSHEIGENIRRYVPRTSPAEQQRMNQSVYVCLKVYFVSLCRFRDGPVRGKKARAARSTAVR
jgi:hypothetical protein